MKTYQDIKVILATKHNKEKAIKKPFEDAFNAQIIIPKDYDTDQFGTFTGEIPRENNAYDTVIKKARMAATQYGFDYSIASEGSFGVDQAVCFLPVDTELMCFLDKKNDLIIVEAEITTETNYAHQEITVEDSYDDFLNKIKFGSHGLIIRSLDDNSCIAKGITRLEELNNIVKSSLKNHEKIRLETDMRAMMNPTRMAVINKLAVKLAKRLQKKCSKCGANGFGKTSVTGSLLCRFCRTETHLYKFKVLSCVKCDSQELYPRDDELEYADQKYCPYCNP